MTLYTFTLENFGVMTTRSRHEDTDTVVVGLQVGGETVPVQSFFAGNVDNGEYDVKLSIHVLIGGEGTGIAYSYQIYNGSNSPEIQYQLSGLNSQQTSQAILNMEDDGEETNLPSDEDSGEVDTGWVTKLLNDIFGSIVDFFGPDCDGMVASQTVGVTKSTLDDSISAMGGTGNYLYYYPGASSPAGCGRSSRYSVNWSVTRDVDPAATFSLRTYLQENALLPTPGIRSLDLSNTVTTGFR